MNIGIVKEIKANEDRVILTPNEVTDLVLSGHNVMVQSNAGKKAGFCDKEYLSSGATISNDIKEIYKKSDLIAKVKEIFPEEYPLLREDQIIFTCVHPAANKEEVEALLQSKVIAFTAEDSHRYGSPNCEAAGKIGALMGAYYLLSLHGGKGQTIFGIGGAPAGKVLVLGAGIAGKGACEILTSMGGYVYLMDINIGTLREAEYSFPNNLTTYISNRGNILELLPSIDLIINCVKWPKHRKDHLIYKDDLKLMKAGSVIVDVSADVGGAIETYKPTTHLDPIYEVNGIIHYGVDNIPGSAPHTASKAYAASIFNHIKSIADLGVKESCRKDGYLRRSLCTYKGELTHEETSIIQEKNFTSVEKVLEFDENEILDYAPKATTTVLKK